MKLFLRHSFLIFILLLPVIVLAQSEVPIKIKLNKSIFIDLLENRNIEKAKYSDKNKNFEVENNNREIIISHKRNNINFNQNIKPTIIVNNYKNENLAIIEENKSVQIKNLSSSEKLKILYKIDSTVPQITTETIVTIVY